MKYGFIGCGNMGSALIKAVAKKIGGENLFISDFDKTKAENLAKTIGAYHVTNREIASNCDFVVVGVKPQVIKSLFEEIGSILNIRNDVTVISMAAGVSVESIQNMLNDHTNVIRIMPNLPAEVNEGVILYCTSKDIENEKVNDFLSAFSLCGVVDKIGENLIDAASAVSGCGPAFVFMFIQSLADAAVSCGIPRDKALLYASQTVLGAAKLAITTGEHPEKLKDAVCSPGGSTIAGVAALEDNAFRSAVEKAVVASYKRTTELFKK